MSQEPDGGGEPISPERAFALLGNETRMDVLRVLWEEYDPFAPADRVPFSVLFDGVDIDDTGNFNYHLQKLIGHFVRSNEAGYALTHAGFDAVQSVVAGSSNEGLPSFPVRVDAACPRCDGQVVLDYADEVAEASCTDCSGLWASENGGFLFRFEFPPAGFAGRTVDEAFDAILTYEFNHIEAYQERVCPRCGGGVDSVVEFCESHSVSESGVCPDCERHRLCQVSLVCTQCKSALGGPASMVVLTEPAVRDFLREQGVEERFGSWETFRRGETIEEELVQSDPPRLRLTIPCGDDSLRVTLDETLAVVTVDD